MHQKNLSVQILFTKLFANEIFIYKKSYKNVFSPIFREISRNACRRNVCYINYQTA